MVRVCDSPSQLGNELDTMWKVTVFLSSSTRVGAEHRKAAAHDGAVFLGRAGEAVVGSDLRHVAGDVDLREVADRLGL